MFAFIFLWALTSLSWTQQAAAYYDSGYHYYPSYRSHQPSQIISIDMDPQHQIDASFRIAAREERIKDMISDHQHGANINSASDAGRTALMFASQDCSTRVVRELIKLGADVNLRDRDGETAIDYATFESCYPVVKLLLKVPGIELHRRDRSGKSVFDYAADCAELDVDGEAAQIYDLLRRHDHGRLRASK